MNAPQSLHNLGQSLWLDNITRGLLTTGTLRRYVGELSVTGLTSNPTIFDEAIKKSSDYDASIRKKLNEGRSGEDLFFDVAIEDIAEAADIFASVHERTLDVDGWVSLEVSPLLAYDTKATIAMAKDLHARVGRPNVLIKDSRHEGRSSCHRRGHLCRHPSQRHASVLAGAISGSGRSLYARHRTPN